MVHAQKTWFHCGFRRVKLTANVVSGKILFKHICICVYAMKNKTHPLEYLLTRGVNNKKEKLHRAYKIYFPSCSIIVLSHGKKMMFCTIQRLPKTRIIRDSALEIQCHITTCSGNPDSVAGTRLGNGFFLESSKNFGSDVQLGSTIWALSLASKH